MTAEDLIADNLYDAFALYGSGVALVAVRDGDRDCFFVAASVLTASVDPFALAVSVGRDRDGLAAIASGAVWSVSLLGAHHEGLVRQLTAGPREGRRDALLAAGAARSPEGPLHLPDALVALWCTTRGGAGRRPAARGRRRRPRRRAAPGRSPGALEPRLRHRRRAPRAVRRRARGLTRSGRPRPQAALGSTARRGDPGPGTTRARRAGRGSRPGGCPSSRRQCSPATRWPSRPSPPGPAGSA